MAAPSTPAKPTPAPDATAPSEPASSPEPSAAPETTPEPVDHAAETAVDKLKQKPSTPEGPVQTDSDAEGGRSPAPPPITSADDPCERPDESDIPVIDDTRQMLEEQTCGAALWLDSLFGEKGNGDAARRTRGFLELTNVYSQFGGFSSRSRLHVEYDLPNMENRLSAFIGREDDEDFVRGRTENAELRSTFPSLGNDNKWLAGLGYSLPGTKNLQTSFRVGVRGLAPPTGFVQGRLRYTIYSDDDDVAYIRTTPFWNTHDGFGITQSFDYSHVLNHRQLVRLYTVGTVSERTIGLNWRQSLILYQNLQRKRGLAYEAFIRGETDNPEPLYEYGARVLLRHPFLQQRLFLEWSLGYSFPRIDPEEPRDGSYNAGLSIELPFGTVDDDLQ